MIYIGTVWYNTAVVIVLIVVGISATIFVVA